MIVVFCEECGARNVVETETLKGKDSPRCQECNDILRLPVSLGLQAPPETLTPQARLELRFREHVIEISRNRPSVTMGRQSHNNLVIEDSRVSRSHARIVYRQDKFVLIDHSTNGTYVFIKGGKGMNLKQNEIALSGSGIFGLGRRVAPDSDEAIHFDIKM